MKNKLKYSIKRMLAFVLSLAIVFTTVSFSHISVSADDNFEILDNQEILEDEEMQIFADSEENSEVLVEESALQEEYDDNSEIVIDQAESYPMSDDVVADAEDAINGCAEDEDAINTDSSVLDKPEILYVRQAGDGSVGAFNVIFKKPVGVKTFTISLKERYQEAGKEIIKTIKEYKNIDASSIPNCPKEKADNNLGYLVYRFGGVPAVGEMKNTYLFVSANAINPSVGYSEDKHEVSYIYENGLYDISFDPTLEGICNYSVGHTSMRPYDEINDEYMGDEEVSGKAVKIYMEPKDDPSNPESSGFVVKAVGVRYKQKGVDKLKYAVPVLKPNKKSIDYWKFTMPPSDVVIHIVKGDEEMEEPDEWDISGNEIEEPVPDPADDMTLGDDIIEEDKSYPNRIDLALKATDTKVTYTKKHTYTGMYIKPTVQVTVMEDGKRIKLVEGTDYIRSYQYNRDCRLLETDPKPLIIIKGNGHYKGRVVYSFDIEKKSIKKCKAVVDTMTTLEHEYAVEDRVKIYDGSKLLVQYKDYSLDMSKENFNKSGKTYVYATGIGNYKGKLKIKVNVIKPKAKKLIIRSASINATKADTLIYRAKAYSFKSKDFTVYADDGTLVPTKHYTVSAKRVTNVGKGYVAIKGTGKKYRGTVYVPVEIKAPKTEFELSELPETVYSGTLKHPKPVVKVELNGKKKKLKLNRDYKITYADNLYAHKTQEYAMATVIGIGNYAGVRAQTAKFIIKPYDIKNVKATGTKKEGITLTFNGRKLVKGVDFDYDERAGWKDELPEGIYTKIEITGLKNFAGSSYEGKFKIRPDEKKETKKETKK